MCVCGWDWFAIFCLCHLCHVSVCVCEEEMNQNRTIHTDIQKLWKMLHKCYTALPQHNEFGSEAELHGLKLKWKNILWYVRVCDKPGNWQAEITAPAKFFASGKRVKSTPDVVNLQDRRDQHQSRLNLKIAARIWLTRIWISEQPSCNEYIGDHSWSYCSVAVHWNTLLVAMIDVKNDWNRN